MTGITNILITTISYANHHIQLYHFYDHEFLSFFLIDYVIALYDL